MQPTSASYDIIILGAGCAGLSVLMRILADEQLSKQSILLIDQAPKIHNDRTWCFWEKEPGFFEPVVHHQWKQLRFESNQFSSLLHIGAYTYKMIRGIDFYTYCFEKIKQYPNVTVQYDTIQQFSGDQIQLAGSTIACSGALVLNSTYITLPSQKNSYRLLQHFKGRVIETEQPFFDATTATIMDFRTAQYGATAFVYTLPLSPYRALVEYTQFSSKLLLPQQYEASLDKYISETLQLQNYTLVEEEFGVIPMTNANFELYSNGVYHLGTAGGQTKSSSGYTFQFIQKQSDAIVQLLKQGKPPLVKPTFLQQRFHWYDSTLLHILAKNKMEGNDFFTRLYSKNDAALIFKFLDNETSIVEELKIMNTVPRWLFTRVALQELLY